MRDTLIATLIEALWNDPDTRAYRAAMRTHDLTEAELTAMDRGIMTRTLAANDAARQTTDAAPEILPDSLEELSAEPTGEISPMTGRRQRRIVYDALVIKTDGHTLDIPAMQARYATMALADGRYHARTYLLGQLAWHVERTCPELTADGHKAQVRLAANAIFAGTGQPAMP